jgi:hypothetical protein
MGAKRHFIRRGIAWLCLLTLISGQMQVQAQQTQTVIVVSADEYWVVRPATCPTHLRGGLYGWLFGYPHAGFEWTAEWTRYRIPNQADYSHAEYHPASYDGYAQGKGDYIKSNDGDARWYEPELYVRCTATDKFFLGHLISVTEHYSVLDNRGEVVVCKGGTALLDEPTGDYSGSGPDATYDPYNQFEGSDGCESEGSSSGGGGNTATCWNEYIYVEISYDDGATWEIIWAGWAQVCE